MKKIHIMGIGGSGASAVAAIADSQGYFVSGCDLARDSQYLKNDQFEIKVGHTPNHINSIDLLVVSPAILKFDPKNSEVFAARKKKIPVLTWQKFMGKYLQKDKFVIAISGTHGKSTTTAMLGHVLEDAGHDPIVELGANDLIWGKNFRIGKSKYFVCEADEYNNNFLNYKPNIAVVTNIEWDHPDFFKTEDKVFQSFIKFIKNNPILEKLCVVKNQSGIDRFLTNLDINHKNPKFINLVNSIQKLNLKLPGIHNQINANLAKAVAIRLGIEPQIVKKSLENFAGLERRFELVGKFDKIQIYQDYAHHPTELKALFDSITEKLNKKNIWLVFQPHTYSRTIALFDDFVTVFKNSSLQKIIILPIFASRERNYKSVSSQKLASAIGNKAQYIGSFGRFAKLVKDNKSKIDLLFIVGAGDIYKLTEFF